MKRVIKACFIALALVLMVTPLVACGGGGTTPPSGEGGNQSPVINSLTAEEATITPNAETRVTCDATDPDNDKLTYTWKATGGDFTAYGRFIDWKAPDFTGEFTVSVTVDDGQNDPVASSCTITVVTNQLPVINSLTAEPATLQPGETSTVTCSATDPDGDTLAYTWSASGGTISGTEDIVTWQAPSVTGEFLISVEVDDDKGGTVEGSCRIVVGIPETTVILPPLANESGSIYYDGTIITQFKIGDNAQDVPVRPYFSFDISGLTDAEIKEAKLTFTVKETIGNPWFTPPYLYIEWIDYGARSLEAADFHSVLFLGELQRYNSTPPTELDVRVQVEDNLEARRGPRFQIRMRLADPGHNFNSQADYIEFSQAELTVTYVK
jgi:hypothetical protein